MIVWVLGITAAGNLACMLVLYQALKSANRRIARLNRRNQDACERIAQLEDNLLYEWSGGEMGRQGR